MLLMEYPSIRGEDLPDYAKKYTCNLLHAYIDANSQGLINEYPVDGYQAISRLQSKCANINFYNQSIYNRIFHQVINQGGESEINYINIFQNAKALEISVGNSYSEDQLMNTFLDNLQQGRNCSDQIENHRVKLRREENLLIKNHFLLEN